MMRWLELRRALRRTPAGGVGSVIVVLMILVAVLGPRVAPYAPNTPDYAHARQGPSWAHLGGTDDFGRDILSRVLYGARISITVGFLGVVIGLIPGAVLGLMAGYYGGWLDEAVMRVIDVLLAFPGILLAIAMVAVLGPGLVNIVIAIGFFGIPVYTRLVRGSTLQAKGQVYVEAIRAQGAGSPRIIFRHILPNVVAPIIVISTLQIASAILTESALSFLGLGAPPPTPEWGAILTNAKDDLATLPYMAIFPGAALVVTVLGFNLLGDGLRDVLDPRMKT
jgi:ABC-type dipeptide/oligopeptide/nickel transport system permease subunit